ncbi:MAG: hypothetical protein H8E25_06340 [Planctomycetes bacterium]|nr:hypothetical protein [Planctomycetota bacterium]
MILPFLLSLVALSPAAFPQDIFGPAKKEQSEADAVPAVIVKSVAVSLDEQYSRALIYTSGSRYVLQRTLNEVLVDEIARRKDAGIYIGDIDISKEDIDEQIQKRVDLVLNQDPTLDFWEQVKAQGFTQESFRDEMRRNIQAQRMFFPADPSDWPVEQLAEILGQHWNDFLKEDHQTLLEQKEKGEVETLDDQMMNQFLMPPIWMALMKSSQIVNPSDGLPEGVALRVNGRDIATKELREIVEPMVSDVDREWAQSFVSNINLATNDLKANGNWMSDSDYMQALSAERAEYEGTIIPHEMMILQFLGFPSMEIYYQYFRARHSFINAMPSKDSEEYAAMVEAIIAERGPFYSADRMQVDVILLGARSKTTGRFPLKGDPFAGSLERATEVSEILAEEDADWKEILLDYSDYPETVGGAQSSSLPQPHRGMLPVQSRNDLRGFLMENDYTNFIMGTSMADQMYFSSEIGKVYGPIKNPLGYSFYRINQVTPGSKTIDYAGNERDAYIINDDLLTTRFHAYVRALGAKAK